MQTVGRLEDSEFRRGGKPLAGALLGLACGAAALPFTSLAMLLGPIQQAFGWSFSAVSSGITVTSLMAALTAPFYGRMADTHGARRVAIFGLVAFAAVFASFGLMTDYRPLFYLLWAALGLVAVASSAPIFSRTIALWFVRNRGFALGLLMVSMSIAGFCVPQITQAAIDFGGWRLAFPVLALLPLCLGLPAVLVWFRSPPGAEEEARTAAADRGDKQALIAGLLVDYRFWILFVSTFLVGLAYAGAHIHMAQIIQFHGVSAPMAATVVGFISLGTLSGRLVVGFLFDRFWAPAIACFALLLPGLSCYLLMGTDTAYALLVLAALLIGFAVGAESDVTGFFVAKYFGMADFGQILGYLFLPFALSAAISPVIYGLARDMTGGYDLILLAAIFMFVIGGVILLFLGRYPETETPTEPIAAAA